MRFPTMLAIFEIEERISDELLAKFQQRVEERLGQEFKVLVLNQGITCKVVPIVEMDD